jgi:hypothetical protein
VACRSTCRPGAQTRFASKLRRKVGVLLGHYAAAATSPQTCFSRAGAALQDPLASALREEGPPASSTAFVSLADESGPMGAQNGNLQVNHFFLFLQKKNHAKCQSRFSSFLALLVLQVVVSSAGYVTATRVSDGKVLLNQNTLSFMAPTFSVRAGFVASVVRFDGHGPDERIYGLGGV